MNISDGSCRKSTHHLHLQSAQFFNSLIHSSLSSTFQCSQKNRHSNVCLKFLCDANFKGTVMQIEKALTNDRLRVSKIC